MTWHRIWGIKCNVEGCSDIFVTSNPVEEPEGWMSDGTSHVCAACAAKQSTPQPDETSEEA